MDENNPKVRGLLVRALRTYLENLEDDQYDGGDHAQEIADLYELNDDFPFLVEAEY